MRLWSILFLLAACIEAFAQEPSDQDPHLDVVNALINQLGDRELNVRQAAEERLIKIGRSAVDALRMATKSDDVEVVFRSQRAQCRSCRGRRINRHSVPNYCYEMNSLC